MCPVGFGGLKVQGLRVPQAHGDLIREARSIHGGLTGEARSTHGDLIGEARSTHGDLIREAKIHTLSFEAKIENPMISISILCCK